MRSLFYHFIPAIVSIYDFYSIRRIIQSYILNDEYQSVVPWKIVDLKSDGSFLIISQMTIPSTYEMISWDFLYQ